MISLLFYSSLLLLVFAKGNRMDTVALPEKSAMGVAAGAFCFAAVAAVVGTVLLLQLLRLLGCLWRSCCSRLVSAALLTFRLVCHLLQTLVSACACRMDWLHRHSLSLRGFTVRRVLQWQSLWEQPLSVAQMVMAKVCKLALCLPHLIVHCSLSMSNTCSPFWRHFQSFEHEALGRGSVPLRST